MVKYWINENATEIAYTVEKEDNVGTLYRATIKNGKVEKAQKYDEDVYVKSASGYVNDSTFVYYKDYDEDKYDLYKNKELIEYDVHSSKALDGGKKFLCETDYNDKNKSYTLSLCENGKKTKIADDVFYDRTWTDGTILVLTNKSESGKCDLLQFKKDKTVQLDFDILRFVRDSSDSKELNTNITKYFENGELSWADILSNVQVTVG